MSTAPINF